MPKWCLPQDLKAIVYVILLAFGFFCFKLCFVSAVSPPKLTEEHGCDLPCRELTCLTARLWRVRSSHPSGTASCPSGGSPWILQHSNSTEQRHQVSQQSFCLLIVKIRSTICAPVASHREQWGFFLSDSSYKPNVNCLNHSSCLCVDEIAGQRQTLWNSCG